MSLGSIHILVIIPNEGLRTRICQELQARGAVTHAAETRTDALGLFVDLAGHRIIPRAVVTEWTLHDPTTKEHQFYQLIKRNVSTTAMHLIEHVRKFDDNIALVVYTEDEVPEEVQRAFKATVVKRSAGIEALVDALLQDPNMLSMKYNSGEYVLGSDCWEARLAKAPKRASAAVEADRCRVAAAVAAQLNACGTGGIGESSGRQVALEPRIVQGAMRHAQ